jgi:leader peptidase (prepilin peptidase)/N-methyltransferase
MPPSAEMFTVNLYFALASPFIGSAIAAGAARFIAGEAWGLAPSACPACGRRLGVLELIPIASWVVQRGKCRGCTAAIRHDYPVIELGAVGVAVWAWLAMPANLFAATCVMGWLLLALSAIDIRVRRLPDVLTFALALSGLATAALVNQDRLVEHLAGAVFGYLAFVAIELVYQRLRGRDGLGRGDAKLLGGIGAWIGITGLPSCIFVAALSAIAYVVIASLLRGRRIGADTAVFFGPFLAAGGWVVWVYGSLTF